MTTEKIDLSQFSWMNKPRQVALSSGEVEFVTSPDTDFWQRTHYGFRRNTGHAFLTRLWDDFSFTFQTEFFYESQFDQSGLFLYLDEDNWAKASIEYIENGPHMLGSVITLAGYSDWATSPVETPVNRMHYRISRRGSDFRVDASFDGDSFRQIRVFHMPGDLSMARVGIYACSPKDSGFKVRFSDLSAGNSIWND